MADDITFYDEIEAYAGQLSCRVGESMPVHVSTQAERFDVVVERCGVDRIEVWRSDDHVGEYTPAPVGADSAGCAWPVSLQIPVGPDWVTGFYLVSLTAHGGTAGRDVAHAGFVVRPASPTNAALLVLATNTWNAYNTWGGASLYTGGHRVSFRRPWARGLLERPEVERDDRKARPVRFGEEADADGEIFQAYRMANGYTSAIGSTGWFTHERRFVEWAEGSGYTFDYAVSSDLDHDGALDGYDLVLGVGHDEYWTASARDAVDDHIRGGGNYASMSGNTMFWQVRLEGDGVGTPGDDHMVCHKYKAHLDDPVVGTADAATMAGLWCDPLVGRPEWSTIGGGSVFGLYHRFGNALARGTGGFTVYRGDHWLLDGTDLGYGDLLGGDHGVVGYETVGCPIALDEFQLPVVRPVEGMPADVTIVGMALSGNLGVGDYPKSIAALSDQGDLEFMADRFYGGVTEDNKRRLRHGTAVLATCQPFGEEAGLVVTIGSTDWVYGLADDHRVSQVTHNALRRLLGGQTP